MALFSKQKVLSGTLDADFEITGPGLGTPSMIKTLTGGIQGELRGGTFHGKDLIAAVAGPVTRSWRERYTERPSRHLGDHGGLPRGEPGRVGRGERSPRELEECASGASYLSR